ncbi:MAG: amidohydrolase family protein [Chloroflexi bacterium]|nr:amidohydrolase family protein [Chloroflexota bacterium]
MTETVQCDLRINGGQLLNTDTATLAQGDIAVKGDQVIAIENVPENHVATRTIDASGLVVTPGIIDLHTHVAGGLRRSSPYVEDMMQDADLAGVHSGVTTLVDAGSCGISNIGGLVNHVIPNAKTRVLALLNVGSLGVNRIPEVTSALDIEHDEAVATIDARRDIIIGVKARMVSPGISELGMNLPKAAKAIANDAGVRLMVHVGDTTGQSDEALNAAPKILAELLTENDIVTHSFSGARGGLLSSPSPSGGSAAGDGGRTLLREALDARARGVKFDIGVGGKNFSFDAAKRVLDGGLIPDTISSDVTLQSRYVGTSFSQMDCIGKVISLGITLEDALVMSTRSPAAVLSSSLPPLLGERAEGDGGFEQMLGCMAPGTQADLTILRIHEGEWEYIDGDGQINIGPYALEPVSCIRAGQVMPIDYGPREGGWLPNRKRT